MLSTEITNTQKSKAMKIYIMTDLEGVSGVVDFEWRKDESPPNMLKRQRYSRLLTGEVNAAVDGCFAAGATEVLVDDAHGGAYTIDFENVDKRCSVLHGKFRPGMMSCLDSSFDAMLMIGAHAMARTPGGVLYHTMSLDTREIRLNGIPHGEFGIFAFKAGAYNVPTIMISGDEAACREGKRFIKGLVAVAVKKGLSRYSAVSIAPERAREMIREGVIEAIGKLKHIKPYKLKAPFTYQEDGYPDGDKKIESSHPDDLPKVWTTGPMIKARTAKELIKKVWGQKV